jgi:hypothetical protein
MKILTVAAGYEGFGDVLGNDDRLAAMDTAADIGSNQDCDLIAFPGGYLHAGSSAKCRDGLVRTVRDIAASWGRTAAIVTGLDSAEKGIPVPTANAQYTAGVQRKVQTYSLPWYVAAASPVSGEVNLWRQRSSTSRDARLAPAHACDEDRSVSTGGGAFVPLGCGELYNRAITGFACRLPHVIALVDLVHEAAGFRFVRTFERISRLGVACLMSAHARNPQSAVSTAYLACSVRTVPSWTATIPGSPRICLREWLL